MFADPAVVKKKPQSVCVCVGEGNDDVEAWKEDMVSLFFVVRCSGFKRSMFGNRIVQS